MPARYATCNVCERDIDTFYDEYHSQEDSCGCCFTYTCQYCEDGATERGGIIHPYSYRPRPYVPKGNYPDEVLMGVELEIGGGKHAIASRVAQVDSNEEHLYCKEDCSIYGTEIVSHPATLAWVKAWGGYDELLQKLRDDGCTGDKESCPCGDSRYCDHEYGLHIHVSRNAFKQLRKRRTLPEPIDWSETYEQRIGREMREIARQSREQQAINHQMIWLMFLERNADQLDGDTQLARRDSAHYGAFKKSEFRELRQKAMDAPYRDEGRYSAINCQNEKTYELRFFKSTVDTEEFYAAIEFADASVEFTRNIDANKVLRGRALDWNKFVDWVRERATYPNLIAQIDTRQLTNV